MGRLDTPARRVRGRLLLAVLVALLSACTTDKGRNETTSSTSATARFTSSRVAPTGETANCTSAEVRQLVNRFVQAFNAGDQPTLQRPWAQSGHGFDWYSTDGPGQRIDPAGRDRASLGAYFAERHAHQETLRLTSFISTATPPAMATFNLPSPARQVTCHPPPTSAKARLCARPSPRRSVCGQWPRTRGPLRQREQL